MVIDRRQQEQIGLLPLSGVDTTTSVQFETDRGGGYIINSFVHELDGDVSACFTLADESERPEPGNPGGWADGSRYIIMGSEVLPDGVRQPLISPSIALGSRLLVRACSEDSPVFATGTVVVLCQKVADAAAVE